jgi:hypothetical protein
LISKAFGVTVNKSELKPTEDGAMILASESLRFMYEAAS